MIKSKQNSKIKFIRSLSQKKFRDEYGCYLVEGIKMVAEARLSNQTVLQIAGLKDCIDSLPDLENYSSADGIKPEIIEVDETVFGYLSGEVNPQGILAVIKKPLGNKDCPSGKCLLLDRISDPGNLGTIIRTAAAAGFNDIYLIGCADAFNPKTVRASMSGIYFVDLHFIEKSEILKIVDCPIISADMGGTNVFEFEKSKKFCLAIGNEANGIDGEIKQISKYIVSIPMQNTVESLNAGVSAGILMYLL